jgi:hypothetical protein
MTVIKIEKGKCIIELNKRFYPKPVIKEGVESFKGFGTIVFTEKDKVIITPNKTIDVNEIGYDFCDHLLNIIQGGSSF